MLLKSESHGQGFRSNAKFAFTRLFQAAAENRESGPTQDEAAPRAIQVGLFHAPS